MPRRNDRDERQTDFFGVPAVDAPAPRLRAARKGVAQRDRDERDVGDKADAGTAAEQPSPDVQAMQTNDSPETLAASFSPADWDDIAAALPDDVLAHLVIVSVRQLRRRLVNSQRQPGQNPAPALGRAARQIVAELGESGGDDSVGSIVQRQPVARRRSR